MIHRLAPLVLWLPLVFGCDAPVGPDDGADLALPDLGVGDGPDATQTPGWSSGGRLRARIETADGVKRFVTWHDTTLDADCTFSPAADGKTRCVPPTYGFHGYFSDASCKDTVVVFEAGTPVEGFLPRTNAPFVCGTGVSLFAVGATVTPPTIYQEVNGVPCSPVGAPPAGSTVVALGAPIDPAMLVAASEVLEPRGARLRARVLVADDGAREQLDLVDTQRNARCVSDTENDVQSDYACTPSERAYDYAYYSDSGCTTEAAFYTGYTQSRCNRPPGIILRLQPAPVVYYEVGALLTSPVYQRSPSCTQYLPPASLASTFYALGAVVPRSSFAPLTVAREGSGRIRMTTTRVATGELVELIGFYDTTRQITCRAFTANDGKLRCYPLTPYSVNEFSDSSCQLGLFSANPGDPLPPAGTYMESQDALFQLGAKIATPTQTYQVNGTCMMRSPTVGYDYYALTPIAASESPEITRALE